MSNPFWSADKQRPLILAVCSRCGDYHGDVWWSSAPFIPETYWLCSDCVNAVLLIWVIEHQVMIEESLARKGVEHGHSGPT